MLRPGIKKTGQSENELYLSGGYYYVDGNKTWSCQEMNFESETGRKLVYPYIYKINVVDPYTVSNESEFNHDNIAISPNPAGDYIEISLGKETASLREIRIYNTLGECVLVEQTSLPVQRLDISALPPGIYFVRLGEWVGRFVKI